MVFDLPRAADKQAPKDHEKWARALALRQEEGYANKHAEKLTLDEYARRAARTKTSPAPPEQLLTDRAAYMTYLESQLERVSASCLVVESYEARLQDLVRHVRRVEEKVEASGSREGAQKDEAARRDELQRLAVQHLANRVGQVERDLSSHPFAVVRPDGSIPGVDMDIHQLDLRVLDAKFRTWAQAQERKFTDAATAMEKQVMARMDAVLGQVSASRAELDRHVDAAKAEIAARTQEISDSFQTIFDEIKVAAAAAVQAAFGGHVEDVRRLAAGLQTRLEDVAQQAASREEIRRTLDALELVPWVGGGGGAGHGAQGDAAAFQRAVAEARAAFRDASRSAGQGSGGSAPHSLGSPSSLSQLPAVGVPLDTRSERRGAAGAHGPSPSQSAADAPSHHGAASGSAFTPPFIASDPTVAAALDSLQTAVTRAVGRTARLSGTERDESPDRPGLDAHHSGSDVLGLGSRAGRSALGVARPPPRHPGRPLSRHSGRPASRGSSPSHARAEEGEGAMDPRAPRSARASRASATAEASGTDVSRHRAGSRVDTRARYPTPDHGSSRAAAVWGGSSVQHGSPPEQTSPMRTSAGASRVGSHGQPDPAAGPSAEWGSRGAGAVGTTEGRSPSALRQWEGAVRQLLDNVQRTVGEINTSYAAVQGALRGAAGAVHFSSLEGGRDAQGRHAEAQAMAQADREARQEAALRDILVKVEVWRGEVEGLAGLHAHLGRSAADAPVARALEALTQRLADAAGMFDAEQVARQLAQVQRDVASGADANAAMADALHKLAQRVEQMAEARGRPPFVVPTSREYTEQVKRDYYQEEDRAYWERASRSPSLGNSPVKAPPGPEHVSYAAGGTGMGGGSASDVPDVVQRAAESRKRLNQLYADLDQLDRYQGAP